ncbi:DUF4132 domain-containing protein [Siphonobacter sp. SORGH_AS_1065]|uniref:DUF4132 domain-containing protein n=1 Tax=Siphonobacter sp. SORGH_AS_1065 TaxID=3041795 RepID=UPI002787EB42|nr:DUF4132 domain-containing protein [Siphonobacter sp. SORGH_AS_1065]MDQ1089774.1 hypothetical protein [Siphonobacter sp. SORGH_AS_1065]
MSTQEEQLATFFKAVEGESEFDRIIRESGKHYLEKNPAGFSEDKILDYSSCPKEVRLWDEQKKIDFLFYCLHNFTQKYTYSDCIKQQYVWLIIKDGITLTAERLELLWLGFTDDNFTYYAIAQWPLASLINQIYQQFQNEYLPADIYSFLTSIYPKIRDYKDSYSDYSTTTEPHRLQLLEAIFQLITPKPSKDIWSNVFVGVDAFATHANTLLLNLPIEKQLLWFELLGIAKNSSGSKPNKKFLATAQDIIHKIGKEDFHEVIHSWFEFLSTHKFNFYVTEPFPNGTYYDSELTGFIGTHNQELIKYFVWMCTTQYTPKTVVLVAAVARRFYSTIPGYRITGIGLGNACVYALSVMEGGVTHLSRLKLKVKQPSLKETIEKALYAAAEHQGVSIHEVQEMALDNYGLENGTWTEKIGDYQATLQVTGVGKSELLWQTSDGSIQKSIPKEVKDNFGSELRQLKELQKQVNQTGSVQRDRIDRIFRSNRSWTMEKFQDYYLHHGLMALLTKQLIWVFEQNGIKQSAFYWEGQWQDSQGKVVEVSEEAIVTLWHPALVSTQETQHWRAFMNIKQIVQPIKQAYREVYLLTDAERQTQSYSNRMAAHFLKQHQFNMLAKHREWSYTLAGVFDNGHNGRTELKLPDLDLGVYFTVHYVAVDEHSAANSGVFKYISTDSIRFYRLSTSQGIDLVDVPTVAFSEVMRDCDLFVGVCSVGNDPDWQDSQGEHVMRDYWQNYSLGDLSETAKNRREILSDLLPRLKIGKVSELTDKYLRVQGKLRTYKIHLDSTNILMEPNDQYLCIVQDRTQKDPANGLFIPFERDEGLSMILSKALLLADDHKIKDEMILSQINR